MISDSILLVTKNIAVSQSQDSYCLMPTVTFPETAELYGTFSLPVAKSRPLVEDQFTTIKLAFGSWLETGDEDAILEEIYKSRLTPSSSEK